MLNLDVFWATLWPGLRAVLIVAAVLWALEAVLRALEVRRGRRAYADYLAALEHAEARP